MLATSVARAAGVGAVSTVLGLLMALALGDASRRWRGLVLFAMLFPVFLPTYITTMVWIGLLGRGGLLGQLPLLDRFTVFSWCGCLWVFVLCYWPYAGLLACAARGAIPRAEIEAALVMGGRRAAMRGVIVRRVLPSADAGGLLAFALSLADFDIPALLIQRSYSAEIFYKLEASYDTAAAAWMLAPLMGVILMAAAVVFIILRRQGLGLFRTMTAVDVPLRGVSTVRASRPLIAFSVFVLFLSAGAPLLSLVVLAWPPGNVALAVQVAGSQWWNSSVASVLAATVSVVLGIGILSVLLYRRVGYRRAVAAVVGVAALFAFVIPGSVLGLGLTEALASSTWLAFLYDGMGMLVIAYLIRFFIFLWLPASMAARRLADSSGFEAARLAPGGRLRLMHRILLPLMVLPLAVGWLLVCCLSLGELAATIIVAPPGCDTLGMKIFDLLHFGHRGVVAGLCGMAALLVACLSFAATQWMQRYEISRG